MLQSDFNPNLIGIFTDIWWYVIYHVQPFQEYSIALCNVLKLHTHASVAEKSDEKKLYAFRYFTESLGHRLF